MRSLERLLVALCTISGREAGLLLLVVTGAALAGLLVSQALPPLYRARVPLAAIDSLGVAPYRLLSDAAWQLAVVDGVRINPNNDEVRAFAAAEVTRSDPTTALAEAHVEADKAIALFPAAVRRAASSEGDFSSVGLVRNGEPSVKAVRQDVPAAVVAGMFGLLLGLVLVLRRRQAAEGVQERPTRPNYAIPGFLRQPLGDHY